MKNKTDYYFCRHTDRAMFDENGRKVKPSGEFFILNQLALEVVLSAGTSRSASLRLCFDSWSEIARCDRLAPIVEFMASLVKLKDPMAQVDMLLPTHTKNEQTMPDLTAESIPITQ